MSNDNLGWPPPTRPEAPDFTATWPQQPGAAPSAPGATNAGQASSPGFDTRTDVHGSTNPTPGFDTRTDVHGSTNPTPGFDTRTDVHGSTNGGRPRRLGVLVVATLAGLLGGVGGAVATNALLNQPQAASSSSSSNEQGQGNTNTVVQADPNNPDWTAVAEAAADAVVAIQTGSRLGPSAQGSGVVIDAAGHIVTNNHVIANSEGVLSVLLNDGYYAAELVGADPSTDLAVIRLTNPPENLTVMNFGDNNALRVGDPVMAIGNPLGLSDTVTTGIVSALNRPVTTRAVTNENVSSESDSLVVTAAIQTNAAINPGNSGGALVNASGELVGITTSIATVPSTSSSSGSSGNIGIGFAIGTDQVQYVANQLIANGVAEHPQIGVSAEEVDSGRLGALVASITPGSPAEQAGLAVGDVITSIDGKPTSSVEQLVAVVRAGQVGKEMKLTVVRDSSEQTVSVTPIAAPN